MSWGESAVAIAVSEEGETGGGVAVVETSCKGARQENENFLEVTDLVEPNSYATLLNQGLRDD
jgi:hypothetical protein